jgi:hypothetical protein
VTNSSSLTGFPRTTAVFVRNFFGSLVGYSVPNN